MMPVLVAGVSVPRTDPAMSSGDLMALGRAHTCAVAAGRVLHCWGANDSLQLGMEPQSPSHPEAVVLDHLGEVSGVVAAADYTCVRRARDVVCWGYLGALGITDGADGPSQATRIAGLEGAIELAAGPGHLCARFPSGNVACLGQNDRGQLGDGTTTSRARPVAVVGLTDAVQIGVGRAHSCARRGSDSYRSEVVCWGGNEHGQLGDGSREDRLQPVPVQTLETTLTPVNAIFDLAVGATFTCAQPADQAQVPTYCWGTIEDHESGLVHEFGQSATPFPFWL